MANIVTLSIDPALYAKFKEQTKQDGEAMSRVVAKMMTAYLAENRQLEDA
jgi:metal-responsive CopG/Arc/MetJ family transcriptional regulator